jgi:hypothetical protein
VVFELFWQKPSFYLIGVFQFSAVARIEAKLLGHVVFGGVARMLRVISAAYDVRAGQHEVRRY